MKLDIYNGSSDKIIVFEGDNLLESEVITLIKDDKVIDLTGLTCDMGYVDINTNNGDIIENLKISSPTEGKIELPINSSLTKKDGIYDCELRLKSSKDDYVKFTAFFSLIIKGNVFNKIGNKILSNDSFSKIDEILKQADGYKQELDKKIATINLSITTADTLNTKLVNNTNTADALNKTLVSNIEEAKKTNEDSITKDTTLKETIKNAETINEELTANENQATLNEAARKKNEAERIEAEKIREEKIEEFGSQVTKNTKEIDSAKGEYDTLKARLDRENEKVYETINNKDFLPFEGTDITVEHSKVGFTKDTKIEGRTLQNLLPRSKYTFATGNVNNGRYTKVEEEKSIVVNVTEDLEGWLYISAGAISKNLLKANTTYTIIGDFNNITSVTLRSGDNAYTISNSTASTISTGKATLTIKDQSVLDTVPSNREILVYCSMKTTVGETSVKNVMVLEGDWTNKEIPPYFEGIQSVGESEENKISISSSNKNLFNVKEFCNSSGNKEYYESDGAALIVKKLDGRSGGFDFIQKIEKNTNYYLSCDELSSRRIYLSKDKINWTSATFSTYFNSDENEYVTFKFVTNNFPTNLNVMLEKGTQLTSYQPYKEDKKEILLTDCLRGVEGVYDSIENRNDGVYLVQRFRKKILDGTELMAISNGSPEYMVLSIMDMKPKQASLICDNLPVRKDGAPDMIGSGNTRKLVAGVMTCGNDNEFRIRTGDLSATVEGSMRWLQANPVTIYYELAKPIETKLDISTLNLETFKDVTHVFSENAIAPNLSFKAPVDVPATLSSLRSANTMLMAQNTELQNKNEHLEEVNKKQTTKIIELDDTTNFLIEDALSRKINN